MDKIKNGRKITVSIVEQKDMSGALLRILSKGRVDDYIEECMREYSNPSSEIEPSDYLDIF